MSAIDKLINLTISIMQNLLCWLVILGFTFGLPAYASAVERNATTRSIAQLRVDDDGRFLKRPTAVSFDPVEEEIYLVNNGSSRIVVYGPDFYPRMSIGVGRGVTAPFSAYVTEDGHVYIAQPRNAYNPLNRVTVLNAAFFVEKDIIIDDIPASEVLIPKQVAVSRNGLIYVVGDPGRGVLVLDNDGTFLRLLQPMDTVLNRAAIEAASKQGEEQEEELSYAEERTVTEADDQEDLLTAEILADIPEEFRPRNSSGEGSVATGPGLGAVRIRNIHIDDSGKIYLVSAETGRIYVYSEEEEFLFAFGEKGGSPRKLSQPYALDVDEKRGLIYVVDYMRQTILVYDLTGKWQFEVGGRGTGPGWFNYPMDIAINSLGQIVVADLFNRRVQVLEVEHEYLSPLPEAPDARTDLEDIPPAVDDSSGVVPEDMQNAEATEELPAGEPEVDPAVEIIEEVLPVLEPAGLPENEIEEVIIEETPLSGDAVGD